MLHISRKCPYCAFDHVSVNCHLPLPGPGRSWIAPFYLPPYWSPLSPPASDSEVWSMGSPRRMLEGEVVVFIPATALSAGLPRLAVTTPPR